MKTHLRTCAVFTRVIYRRPTYSPIAPQTLPVSHAMHSDAPK